MDNKTLPLGKLPAALLDELIGQLPMHDPELIIPPGVGHDAAGLKIGERYFAVTTDPITFASDRLGTYSISVNLNDIACMGCRPRWYTGCMLLPKTITEDAVRKIWSDLTAALIKYDVQSIGGHVEVTEAVTTPVIVGQMIGENIGDKLLNISDAKADDKILLCQNIAIEGTALIATELADELAAHFSTEEITDMQNLLDDPGICIWPLVKQLIPDENIVAIHDPTEGGIATAINEIADACKCGFAVERANIPLIPATKKLAEIFNIDPLGLLASGSVLIICKAKGAEQILKKLPNTPVTIIGELVADKNQRTLPRYDSDEIIKILTG